MRLSVVAIVAAYNEADIIRRSVLDLVGQGISVYLLDHGSTDGTREAVEDLVGHGLIKIERYPEESGTTDARPDVFALRQILKRKEQLARELRADWFLNHDVDEFRESPWFGLTLLEGIRRVDALGYNAIDFQIFDFQATDDEFKAGDDPREHFLYYEPEKVFDRPQVRCWKRLDEPPDLQSTMGHDVRFARRRVFPIRFVLRHYRFRGQAHGERKVFVERRPRYAVDERQAPTPSHIQYDALAEGHRFIREPESLLKWDPDAVRLGLQVHNRAFEEVEAKRQEIDALRSESERRRSLAEREIDQLKAASSRLHRSVADLRANVELMQARLHERSAELAAAQVLEQQLRNVYVSHSWRATRPLRLALGALRAFRRQAPTGHRHG